MIITITNYDYLFECFGKLYFSNKISKLIIYIHYNMFEVIISFVNSINSFRKA
jgi:hypothetical protein